VFHDFAVDNLNIINIATKTKKAYIIEPYRIESIFKYGLKWLKNILVNARVKKDEFLILIGLLKNSFLRMGYWGVVE